MTKKLILSKAHLAFLLLLSFFSFFAQFSSAESFTIRQTAIKTTSRELRHLTVNEGFARSAVLDILQDSNGIMWFATWDGIYNFDGYQLKRIYQPKNPTNGEVEIPISIIENEKHQIWIQTASGIYIWDDMYKSVEILKKVTTQGKPIAGLFTFMKKDKDNHIWFGTNHGKIFTCNPTTQRITEESEGPIAKGADVLSMSLGENEEKWLCTKNHGIFKMTPDRSAQKQQISRDPIFDTFNKTTTFCLYKDKKRHYWIATTDGIFFLKNTKNPVEKSSYKFEYPKGLSTKEIQVYNFVENNKQLFASSNLGLFVYDYQQNTASWYVANKNVPKSLNDKNIRKVLIDNEGGIWLGTFNGGVNYLSPTSENFSSYDPINNQINGHVISGIVENEDGNMWISTEDGGYSFWNRKTNLVENFLNDGRQPLAPTVNNIQTLFTRKDKLYLGMYNGGMDIIDLKAKTKKNYNATNTQPAPLPHSIYAFQPINDSQILIGTINGLYVFDEPLQEFHRIPECQGKVNGLIHDRDKNIWAATNTGIYQFTPNMTLKEHLHHSKQDSTSLVSDNVTALAAFGSAIYIGTNGKGLWSWQQDEHTFKRIAEQPLTDAAIYKIIVDNDNLWISTNKGLYNYNINTQLTKVYTSQDGIRYNQFKINSGCLTRDHILFLGSVFGLTGFSPHQLFYNTTRPKITITDLYVFHKPVDITDEHSPLKVAISYADEITLHRSLNNFSFQLASSSYSQAGRNIYEYKLVPFENEWQRTANGNNAAYYTNVPAGEYTLLVRTSNGNNLWSEEKCLKVTMRPYWWASIPMKILYLVLGCGLLGVFVFLYAHKKKKEIYLLKLEKEQDIYHSKMEFFTFMIHEIRTPLTLILGPLSDVMERKGKIEEVLPELSTIKRNANRLLALVNQLMDFRKVEEKSYTVQIGKMDLKDLIEQIVQNFHYNCTHKHITLVQHLPAQPCWAKADREAMNKIITNLLSNASKFTTDRIEIGLYQSQDNETWNISVKDNGKGIGKTDLYKIFDSFYQIRQNRPNDYIGTGVGLSVVKHLLELQEGTIRVESQIGEGACFIANIPADNSETVAAGEETAAKVISLSASDKYRLLVVEDNDEMRQYIQSIFEPSYQVDACANGKEALDLTQQQGYDLVLTDWMMPVMDGITLARTLKHQDQTCHIPIVILTAKDDESSQIEGFTSHADAYVVKPFSAKVLMSQVEAIIKNRESIHKDFLKQPDTSNDLICQNDLDKAFIEKLDALIDERIMNTSISIDELASNLCMGRTSFYQKIKGIVGVTPNEYVSTYKLKKAAQIMRKGNVRINEVCYMVGFSSSSYFAKKFAAQFGISPTEYQKSALKK